MNEQNCISQRYILTDELYCELENKTIQRQDIYNQNNIYNSTTINTNGIAGFTGAIENAGCTGDITSQENHVLETIDGNVEPKNIVLRTDGSNTLFGSFFRDDTKTTLKGDIRGSGATDLSVSRTLCSQVASGNFSSILGGRNNTASGELSVVVGGDSNISSGINSAILGGTGNNNRSDGSVIVSGRQNSTLAGGSGLNLIGAGISNTVSGGYNSIINGVNNNIRDINSTYNSIIGGSNNLIEAVSKTSLIASGMNNFVSGDNQTIISGMGNTAGPGGSGGNFIGSGTNNYTIGGYNAILIGQNNKIDSNSSLFNVIVGGTNNRIDATSRNSMIGAGIGNTILNGNSCISCGTNNTISADGSGGNFIGGGTGNFISGGFNAILNGEINSIDSSINKYNAIINGVNNRITAQASNSMIGSGSNNIIYENNSVICGGINNTIQVGGTGSNFIGGGTGNYLVGSFNAILIGSENRIDNTGSSNSAILAGQNNRITSNIRNSMIGAGLNNNVFGDNTAIVAGTGNTAGGNANFIGAGTGNYLIGTANGIVSGSSNAISNSQASFNVILSGTSNNIFSGISNSIIGAGSNNTISANNSGIFSGLNNNIIGPTGIYSAIAGGQSNVISIGNSFCCGDNLELTQYDYPSASFGRFNLQGITGSGLTAGNRIFMVGIGTAGVGNRRNGFSVNDKGLCVANNSFVTGGADFSEYFESHSIYSQKLEYGEPVCMIDDRFLGNSIDSTTHQFILSSNGFTIADIGKIMLAKDVPDEIEPFGVVVGNSGFIGNAHEDEWNGKYERHDDGSPIYISKTIEKEIEETMIRYENKEKIELKMRMNSNGEVEYYQEKRIESIPIITPILQEYPLYDFSENFIGYITKPKIKKIYRSIITQNISEIFNQNLTYIPRSQRPEWNLIAILGQVPVKKDRRTNSRWIKMKIVNPNYFSYLIR
jgi:hypothetical protein